MSNVSLAARSIELEVRKQAMWAISTLLSEKQG